MNTWLVNVVMIVTKFDAKEEMCMKNVRSRYVNPCPKKFKICPDKLVKENIEQEL